MTEQGWLLDSWEYLTSRPGIMVLLAVLITLLVVLVTDRRKRTQEAADGAIKATGHCEQDERRLLMSCEGIYRDGEQHWLRVRVENPTPTMIINCYGKLTNRGNTKFVANLEGVLKEFPLPKDVADWSKSGARFPPEGHRFPWALDDPNETTRPISGYGGFEYLYIAAKWAHTNNFSFAGAPVGDWLNHAIGEFELGIEVGSNTEVFRPTRARLVFTAGGPELKFVDLVVLD